MCIGNFWHFNPRNICFYPCSFLYRCVSGDHVTEVYMLAFPKALFSSVFTMYMKLYKIYPWVYTCNFQQITAEKSCFVSCAFLHVCASQGPYVYIHKTFRTTRIFFRVYKLLNLTKMYTQVYAPVMFKIGLLSLCVLFHVHFWIDACVTLLYIRLEVFFT